jgi:oxygen-independent coproporphyrinogen-3 oxidase
VHLYVHVPFCARRCSYCDFAIAVRRQVPDSAFVDAIRAEWNRLDTGPGNGPVETLYFGGGTPSLLQPESIARLICDLTAKHGSAGDIEITLECNPDDVMPEHARGWRSAGVNRISLGVQSHDPSVLRWMHRTHRAEQVAPAVATLRAAGFDNISLDLIFALPAGLGRNWTDDLNRTLALGPYHISLYGLTIEPHTPLGHWTVRGEVVPAPDDHYATEYLEAHTALAEHGFEFYELSNAARPGRRSRHNQGYWSGSDYTGLGPSAHSLGGHRRRWNIREWAPYLDAVTAHRPSEAGYEILTESQRRIEAVYLGLRSIEGISPDDLPLPLLAAWRDQGWCSDASGRIRLTPEGWLRLDALVAAASAS